MIRFLSLLVGLVVGSNPVALQVGPPVEKVEIRIDDRLVGSLSAPPWTLEVDLGETLQPHTLVAVGFDGAGREVHRVGQWINVEAPAQDATTTPLLVSLDPGVELPSKDRMEGWFLSSGRPLEVRHVEQGPAQVVLVRDPAAQWHFDDFARWFFQLRLNSPPNDLWDPENLSRGKEAFLQAAPGAWAELLDSWNERRSPGLPEEFRPPGLLSGVWPPALPDQMFEALWEEWIHQFGFETDVTFRFLSPRGGPVSNITEPMRVFNMSDLLLNRHEELYDPEIGFLWRSVEARPLVFQLRLADAVAIAGLRAHATDGRRAVVLLLGRGFREQSLFAPQEVRDYLTALQVPLFVWSFEIDPARAAEAMDEPFGRDLTLLSDPSWGDARYVGSEFPVPTELDNDAVVARFDRFEATLSELRQSIARQWVVHVEGHHLTQDVSLSDHVMGVSLIRQAPPPFDSDLGPEG